ncbi:PREDICTED: golgin IMH1-like isoform X2 [Papilio polytes]|uniref:golgin IMH1-like isoform X2 n=1 Tax=Papilio polytes TaxID=76194 RepID=UPI000675E1E5|nr:PREDICTED: golgin IMH1-like isoform X2 [Papilio polytes]
MITRRITENLRNKTASPVIMVPVLQPKAVRMLYSNKNTGHLPDQETINQYEEMEVQQSESNDALGYGDLSVGDTRKSVDNESKQDIINEWVKRNDEFQKMKSELNQRQRSILDLYASLNIIHKKMVAAGHSADVPLVEDLHIMNVAKMTPEQLLKLCAESSKMKNNVNVLDELPLDNRMVLDKLYKIPEKLFATCEQALDNKKTIIEWLDSLKSQISVQNLKQKIQEYNMKNEMLAGTLKKIKNECMTQVQEVEHYIRERVNDTMALHLQTENLTYKLSELNSHNADLQKLLNNAENLKSYTNKNKAEIEKELKDKQKTMRDRLSKAEGQVKMEAEHSSQLEAALNKVNTELESKMALIKQLQEQNDRLKRNYDEELKKLNEAVIENTINLEKIAQDREKIQFEKNDLESKLTQLTMYYNESLNNTKLELKANIMKLSEAETKYNTEIEEQIKLASEYRNQVLEAELQNKLLLQKIEELEYRSASTKDVDIEMNNIKCDLEKERSETKNFKNILVQQTESLRAMEFNLKLTQEENEIMNRNILDKEEYIKELKNREETLKLQLQESESKMEYYEKELMQLKEHIVQLQEQFGGLNDINDLYETKQKDELNKVTNENNELSEKIQKNLVELNEALETNKINRQKLQEKEDLIKTLIKSEEEQCNIIKQLRNNLDVRSNEDAEVAKELEVKKLEINNLANNLETRKQQITQLEKIVLTLEEKVRKSNSIRKKCEEKINLLETKIGIYESHQYKEGVIANSKNLNKFLKLLEEEIDTPMDVQDFHSEEGTKNSITSDKDRHHERRTPIVLEQKVLQKKYTLTDNVVKKANLTQKCDLFNGDHLDRKEVNSKIDNNGQKAKTCGLDSDTDEVPKRKIITNHLHDKILSRNLQALLYGKHLTDKKDKMFVLAGHRL